MIAMETGHFLKMINDASLESLGFLMWKVLGCIICKNPSWVLSRKVNPLRCQTNLPLYTLNGEVLYDSACVKYLGHFICSDLTDDTDILRQRRCLSIQGNVLLRKFHMRSIGVRLALFMSFCSPMYTSQLWWNYKKCTMKRLLITYHNVFKMSISISKYESTSPSCTVYNVLCCQAVIRNQSCVSFHV